MYKEVVVTLYEGSYHLGVATLINSLHASGFNGLVVVGYRGEKPNWCNQLKAVDDTLYTCDNLSLKFELLETNMHFGYYKPFFLQQVSRQYKEADKFYYFDPDIVVVSKWSFLSQWVESGVALCLDNSFAALSPFHPWRTPWRKLLQKMSGFENCQDIGFYVNSGFIGVKRSDVAVIDKWCAITEAFERSGGNTQAFIKDNESAVKTDQDLLNAVLMDCANIRLSIIGKEAMGFNQPAYIMLHAVAGVKPWNRNYIKTAITGIAPTLADKGYWMFAGGVIKNYTKSVLFRKKVGIKVASFIGRFYRKN